MMKEILEMANSLVATPLYLLICTLVIVFLVVYFVKIVPSRNKVFESVLADSAAQKAELAKLTSQYEKTLENSNRVIENNTAALKSTQSMMELFNAKLDNNTEKTESAKKTVEESAIKVNEMNVTLARLHGKIE